MMREGTDPMFLLSIPFWPDQASTYASTIDAIYIALIVLSVVFSVLQREHDVASS